MNSAEQFTMEDALKYLAQRTYSASELRERLGQKHDSAAIESVLTRLESTGLVSEQRVIDSLSVRYSAKRGVGDSRLREQMQNCGISSENIDQIIESSFAPETVRAAELVREKYKAATSPAKIGRFLYSRGFDESTIESVLEHLAWPEAE
jgi:SOS response regulatory protein OraA/RecX